MINTTTSIIVTLFFLHGALACFVAGLHFWSVKDHTIKFFGLGFIFSGLAFSTWAFLAANRLDSLRIIATLAAVFLILGLFSFLLAGIQSLEGSEAYGSALLVGALGALGLFVLRTFVYPAQLIITERGFLLFDLDTVVKAAYILALTVAILPAANAVAAKFKKTYISSLIRGCSMVLVIGGIVLVTSVDTGLILLDGIVMSVAFLLLWTTILFGNRKSWDKVA
jgi:hypothetical protein